MQSEVLKMPFICCAAAIPELQQQRNTEPIRGEKENRTGVPDRRLHGVALLQQHLDERGADVAVPSGHARRLQLLLVARRRRHRRPPTQRNLVVELSMLFSGDCGSVQQPDD